MKPTTLIDYDTVCQLLEADEVLKWVDQTYQDWGKGEVLNPSKVNLNLGEDGSWPHHQAYMNAMPAYLHSAPVAGLKWVGGFGGKRQDLGLPYINGLLLLADPETGEFLAVMDASRITNLRTGAQTAVSLTYLGFQADKSLDLALFGTGCQASNQLQMIAERFTIRHLNLWHYHDEGVDDFIEAHQHLVEEDITYCPDARRACQADIIITATKSPNPIIEPADLTGPAVLFPIGSGQEISPDLILQADQLVVDHPDQVMHRGPLADLAAAGKLNSNDLTADLGELALSPLTKPYDGLTVCTAIGMGALDVAIAYQLYQLAEDQGLGQSFYFKS